MQESPATQCILRVFDGPLRGCEFALTQKRTLFLVGCEADFCSAEHPLTIPESAIYIPLESEGCNFEILLEEHAGSQCVVRVLSNEGAIEHSLPFHTLGRVGGLQIAVRLAGEAWQEDLLVSSVPDSFERKSTRVPGSWLQRSVAGISILLVVGLTAFGWYFSRPSSVSNIEALIAGTNNSMSVVYGRDRAVYVFADTERDAGWGRQVLVRNGYASTQLLTTYGEQARLEGLLASVAPNLAYHRIDLSDPLMPRLLISRQRNLLIPQLQQRLERELSAAAPYAREVKVVSADDAELSRLAEEGLQRLALAFERNNNSDSVTFTVKGSLEDSELQALGDFVAGFNQRWGEHYVHFAIELKDDWLKGKSFQYGPQGYIKMTPSSWYFPKPL
ncbi:PrgH/EprH family type III secretion apparatus protein [Pseudomonas carnis]|uniref:PrgH/EprH family type III secretion apparatus protein n=1 Tax=Pseudomonas TaxID=286 RepID=UPI000F6CE041|nr:MULTISPECIES: PrgH/EprH family type III secretion apparatus protein [Pseudomonas]AZC90093.1 MxiG protein [Pseudomonas chlororaphis subsp. piscium]MBY8955630.1 PrgH/EprH family type III secretion apparatus protein [Pseudomonas carnis]